ncbi:MAG: O-acetyl-ADP-ribose deacetylase [Betaproteobacteria bacterium]|nr:O-acetyl-ADP-ribose deacetylase [Betaproteobacteria bacterium]
MNRRYDAEVFGRLRVVRGDITDQDVDVVVNAANPTLLGGGGVDGAIHRAAGPRLRAYCETLGGCPTGEARISPGFDLRARWIVHTVGPVWHDGTRGEAELLASCYRASLRLASEHDARSIAFPQISTGAYGFPADRAARIAARALLDGVVAHAGIEDVRIVCFAEAGRAHAEAALRALSPQA